MKQKEIYETFKARVKTIYKAKTGKDEDLTVKQMKYEIAHVMKNDTSNWGKVTQVSDSNYWTPASQARRAAKKAAFDELTDDTNPVVRAAIEDAWNAEKIKQKGSGNIYHKYRAPRNCIIVADEVHTKIKSNLTIAARAMWKYCLQTKFVVLATATPVESREELQQIFLLSEILSSNKQYYPYFPPWNPIRDWHGYDVNVFELAKRMRNKISRLNTIQDPESFVKSLLEASSTSKNYKLPKETVFETLLQIPKSNDKLNNNTVRKNILLSIMTNQEEVIKGPDGKIFPSLVPIGDKGYIQCDLNPIYAILDKEIPQHYLMQHSDFDRTKGIWTVDKKYDLAFDGKCGFIMKENGNGEFTTEEISWLQLNQFKKCSPNSPFYSIGICNQNAFLGKYSSDFDERLPCDGARWLSILEKFQPHLNKIDTKWSKCKWLDVNTYRKRYAEKGIPYDKVPVIPDIISTKIKECVYLIEEKVREGKNVMVYHKNVELLRAVNHFLKMRGHRNINNNIMGGDDVLKEYIKERAETRFPYLPEKYRKLQENKIIEQKIENLKPNIHKEYGKLREELLELFPLVNYERYWKQTTGHDPDVKKGDKKGKRNGKNIWTSEKLFPTHVEMLEEIIKYLSVLPVARLDKRTDDEEKQLSLATACTQLTVENLSKRRMSVRLQSQYVNSINALQQLVMSDDPITKFLINYKFDIREKLKDVQTLKARVKAALDKIPEKDTEFDYDKFKQEFGLKFYLLSPTTAKGLVEEDFGKEFVCKNYDELYKLKQKYAPNRFKGSIKNCNDGKYNDKCKQVMPENPIVMEKLSDIFLRYENALKDFIVNIEKTDWELEFTRTDTSKKTGIITDKVVVKGEVTDKPLKSKMVTEPKDVKISQAQLVNKKKIIPIIKLENDKIVLASLPEKYKFGRIYKRVENLIVIIDGYVRRQVQHVINKNILFPEVYNKRIRNNEKVEGISKEEYKKNLQEIIDYGDPNIYKVRQTKMTLGWCGTGKEPDATSYQTISYGNNADAIIELKRRMEFFVPDVINYGIIEGNIKGQTQNSYPAFKDAFKKGALDVLLVSDAGIEGVDYKSCRPSVMICLEPVQIPGKEDQFNGRTVRFKSHYTLPDEMRECEKVTFYTKEFNWGTFSKQERDKSSYENDKRNTYYDEDKNTKVKEDIVKNKQKLTALYYDEKEADVKIQSDRSYLLEKVDELKMAIAEGWDEDIKDLLKWFKKDYGLSGTPQEIEEAIKGNYRQETDTVASSSQTLAEIQADDKGKDIIEKLIELYAEIGITKTKDQIVREAFDQHNPECMTQSQLEAVYNAQLKLMKEETVEENKKDLFYRIWDVNMPKQHAGIQQILKEMGITRTYDQQLERVQGQSNEQFGTICDGVQYKSNTGKSWDTYLDTYVDIRYVPCINNRAYYSLKQLYNVVKNPEDEKHQTYFCFACNFEDNKSIVCEKCKTTNIDQYYYMDKNTFATPSEKLKKQRDHKNKKIREVNRKQRDCLETALTLNSVETTKYQSGDITYKIDADDGNDNNIQTDTVYFRKYFDVPPPDDRKRWQDIVSNPINPRKYKDTFDLPSFDDYKKERLTDKQQKDLDSKKAKEKQTKKVEEKKIKVAKIETENKAKEEKKNLKKKIYRAYTDAGLKKPALTRKKIEELKEIEKTMIVDINKLKEEEVEKEKKEAEVNEIRDRIHKKYKEAGLEPPGYTRKKIEELKEIEKTLTVDIQTAKIKADKKAKKIADEIATMQQILGVDNNDHGYLKKKLIEKAEKDGIETKTKKNRSLPIASIIKKFNKKSGYDSYESDVESDTSIQSEY